MENVVALMGIVLVGLGVAGVPEETGIALIVGGALALGPAIAGLARPNHERTTV